MHASELGNRETMGCGGYSGGGLAEGEACPAVQGVHVYPSDAGTLRAFVQEAHKSHKYSLWHSGHPPSSSHVKKRPPRRPGTAVDLPGVPLPLRPQGSCSSPTTLRPSPTLGRSRFCPKESRNPVLARGWLGERRDPREATPDERPDPGSTTRTRRLFPGLTGPSISSRELRRPPKAGGDPRPALRGALGGHSPAPAAPPAASEAQIPPRAGSPRGSLCPRPSRRLSHQGILIWKTRLQKKGRNHDFY